MIGTRMATQKHPSKYSTNLLLRRLWHVLLLASLSQTFSWQVKADKLAVLQMPPNRRSEGRVLLKYTVNDETINYQMAFSEIIDSETKRSKVSIGYISHPPEVYYVRDGDILTVDKQRRCVSLKQSRHKFVPELDWFLAISFTDKELTELLAEDKAHLVGPSGIISILPKNSVYDHKENHRNIECSVSSAKYDRTKAKNILLEILVPDIRMFDSNKLSFFSLRETIKRMDLPNGDKLSLMMSIDYFYTEAIDTSDLQQLDRLEADLNLPLGVGCSEHLTKTQPKTKTQSFLMTFSQSSSQSTIGLAYDHESNLLRKEEIGRSVAVWDLGEDLIYHVDRKADGKLGNDNVEVPFEVCSVLSIESNESPDLTKGTNGQVKPVATLLKPYSQLGSSIDVLEFIGATELYYMGQTTVRDLPCWLFETIAREPPRIFELDVRVDRVLTNADGIDYIVQFHIFKTTIEVTESQPKRVRQKSPTTLPVVGDQFWPARISLIKRHKESGRTQLVDQLEVDDFHWGLYGWTRKPSELFMIPECFSDEDEQLRLSLALNFEHLEFDDNKRLLRHNKYKLERDLLSDLFGGLLKISPLHLTDFELTLRPHNVMAKLVISDRIEDKKLTFFGEGDLPSANSYLNDRIVLENLERQSESVCLMTASHISQISMVVYCPRKSESDVATCTAIFGESQPVIKKSATTQPQDDPFQPSLACQVYRFEAREPPKSSTGDIDKIRKQLVDHRFKFTVESGQSSVTLDGFVQDFDISRELQLITISNYKYAIDSGGAINAAARKLVRTFDTIAYDSLGDCIKICNIDPSCKSFSYCSHKGVSSADKCVLSSLDLRQSDIEKQLVSAKLIEGNQVVVRDLDVDNISGQNDSALEYRLDLKSGCNIHERNFLSMFTRTGESVSIRESVAAHFMSTPSANECARWKNMVENSATGQPGAMFAFCASSNTCLFDELLLAALSDSAAGKQRDENDTVTGVPTCAEREFTCQVYRRRYQNYFNISPQVVKRQPGTSAEENNDKSRPVQQVDLLFNTVEECARACWDSYGHSCLSFDFCAPQSACTLNLINANMRHLTIGELTRALEWESRTGCLHYEHDLELDELRREHLLGKHRPLGLSPNGDDGGLSSSARSRRLAALLGVTSILFVIGLAVGKAINDRLKDVPLLTRRSHLNESAHSYGAANEDSSPYSQLPSSASKSTLENEIDDDQGAIELVGLSKSTKPFNSSETN